MIQIKKLIFYSMFVIIILAAIALKLFLIFNFPLDQNEPFFTSRANSINQGKVLFTENLFTNHGPLTVYFLSAYSKFFGLSIISVHFAAFLFDILLLLLVIYLIKKYIGKKECLIASAIYLVLSTYCASTSYSSEYPSAFFGILGIVLYFLFLEKNKNFLLFLSGMSIGISIWFKQPGFFIFLAVLTHQFYFYVKKSQSLKDSIKNTLLVIMGSLAISIPLIIYFFYYSGWEFLYELIAFNLLFKTRHSRIVTFGKFIRMLLVDFGFLIAIILSAPKKHEDSETKKEDNKDIEVFGFLIIYSIIMLLFYAINRELFDSHFIPFFPALIFLAFFYIKRYTPENKKLVYVIIIISILALFMINLEYAVREYQKGEKEKQIDVVNYLRSLPSDAKMYFINNRYTYLSGRESTYHYTMDLGPNVEAYEKFEDFCDYIGTIDYMLVTEIQLKYLGEKNIQCIYSKFSVIKRSDDTGDMGTVEILKKNSEL